jgi:hypothetical protein
MTTQSFNCTGSEALDTAAPQSRLCCGFCCDFPLYFSGTIGPATSINPFFPNSFCQSSLNWPLSETPVTLWRTSPCPSISYSAPGINSFGLFIASTANDFYPICKGSSLSGSAFTDRWKVTNATSVTGSCSTDGSGNVTFNMSGIVNNGICQMPFEITSWGGYVTGACEPGPNDRPPTWCVRYEQSDTYGCVTSWFFPGVSGVVTVLSGPYASTSDCNSACAGGGNTPNPWWCVSGNCVQSDARPSGSTKDAYPTQEACLAACYINQGPGFYCHNYYNPTLQQSVVGCDYFMRTPSSSSQRYSTMQNCLNNCGTTTTTTTTEEPTTTTTTEEPPPPEGE